MAPKKKETDDSENKNKKPFKLCFLERYVLGQSNIRMGKSLTMAPTVPLKFYDQENEKIDEKLVDKYIDILKKEQTLDKSLLPKTENQRYGWYQVKLTDADPNDRRINAHKRTNIIVKEHLMNYAKIRG